MKLKHGQRMFFDYILGGLEKEKRKYNIDEVLKDLGDKEPDLLQVEKLHSDFLERGELFFRQVTGRRFLLNILKEDAKLFYIDSMTLDSLFNVPHSNPSYNRLRLPFPNIFFEFEEPIRIKSEIRKDQIIRALLFSDQEYLSERESELSKRLGGNGEVLDVFRNKYSVLAFFENQKGQFFHKLYFDTGSLPNFKITAENKIYEFDYNSEKLFYLANWGEEEMILRNIKRVPRKETNDFDKRLLKNMKKEIDLSINLINYINAQNVVIIRENRERPDLDRINRRRIKKGKRALPQLKPYYWSQIKKSYVRYDRGPKDEWSLEWRIWVRGHFRHYQGQEEDPIWIEPHIRGPENAPWRHHRYAVLYRNFKHLLPFRSNEKIGSWESDDMYDNDEEIQRRLRETEDEFGRGE